MYGMMEEIPISGWIMNYSIVMTTYNGEHFLKEQLDSLRLQTRAPYEVLIFDDGSTDSTASLITEYLAKHHLPWSFFINEKNLGWKKNFMHGIAQATGDIVFLCDQDDIWLLEKCETMMAVMEKKPSCNVLLTNYYPYITDGGTNVSRRSRFHSNNKKLRKIPCTVKYLQANLRPGCTYCVKKSFFDRMSHYWEEDMAHDGFLYYTGLLTQSLFLLNYRSIKFRRHGRNNSPLVKMSSNGIMDNIKDIQRQMENHLTFLNDNQLPDQNEVIARIQVIQRWCRARYVFFQNPSLIKWMVLVCRFFGVYPTVKTMLMDLKLSMI